MNKRHAIQAFKLDGLKGLLGHIAARAFGRPHFLVPASSIDFRNSGLVDLSSLVNLPSSTQFNNKGGLNLDSLTEIPIGFEFNNGTYLLLTRLKRLSPGITFNNTGAIQFESLESISPDFVFEGPEYFYLGPFIEEFFHYWDGNIEGLHPKRLLNKMISLGLFDKDKK